MRALDRKMLRDLWGLRGQALAIAFVILSGVATYVAMSSVMDALQHTLDAYYEDYRFADAFASVRRTPERMQGRLRTVPGVSEVETRVSAGVNLEVPGFDEPVSGLLVSMPEGRQPALNQLFIREGRLVQPGQEDEVLLNETFAEAHDLRPGDRFTAILNGRRKSLLVVGVALSPEYLMQIQPGAFFPDPERFGVMWMGREALSAAYDMEGAFNDVSISFAPGADKDQVVDRLDLLLDPYGGQGAYGREDQPSHFFIMEEFAQLRTMSTLLPIIFLGVAAFLLNIVVTRLISLQREQIAVLKAFGYSNSEAGLHYLKLVILIALGGALAGTALGVWMGQALAELYLEFYRFPYLEYTVRPSVILTAISLTIGASLAGVVMAVRRAVELPPAEAMRPAPPASYRPTLIERLGLQRFLDQPTRMIIRNLERQPVKAGLTIVGISLSCAILIMGLFFNDAFDFIVEIQYGLAQREDLTVTFTEPTSTAALYEIQSMEGVQYAEAFRSVAARVRHEHRSREAGIEGIPPDPYLRRIISRELEPISIPSEGIVLTERLAEILDVQPGDVITVEMLEGRQRTRQVPVVALTQQFIGIAAYMDIRALNRLAGSGDAISGVFLTTDEMYEDDIMRQLRQRPRVASMTAQERAIDAFMETSAESMLTFTFVLSLFAGVIAFGVVYNSARISLSERDRELASLRVLGFTRGEIAYILLGELALVTLLAIPIGLGLGAALSTAIVQGLESDMYQIPVVLTRRTFALAATIVLVASIASAAIVRHRLNRLDLVGVLKTRE